MTAHPPPVPPAQQAPHAGKDADTADTKNNRGVQGPGENVAENTHNKGHQQDR